MTSTLEYIGHAVRACAAAEKGARQLDAVIHIIFHRDRVLHSTRPGWTIRKQKTAAKTALLARSSFISAECGPSPHYSSNIKSAYALLTSLRIPDLDAEDIDPTPDWQLAKVNGGLTIFCKIGSDIESFGNTPELAICGACLMWKRSLLKEQH